MLRPALDWLARQFAICIATLFIAGCAHTAGTTATIATETGVWSGRLALRVASEPVQSFSAAFALRGSSQAGELTLNSPLGTTLAHLSWSAHAARLVANGEVREYTSVADMLQSTTGAAIPLDALFAWLAGREGAVDGWQPDVSRYSEGRISAVRSSPQPAVELRIALDR